MEERLNNAMVLFGLYRSTGNVALLYKALSEGKCSVNAVLCA